MESIFIQYPRHHQSQTRIRLVPNDQPGAGPQKDNRIHQNKYETLSSLIFITHVTQTKHLDN